MANDYTIISTLDTTTAQIDFLNDDSEVVFTVEIASSEAYETAKTIYLGSDLEIANWQITPKTK